MYKIIENKGITLIALVVTIIVLLILAGVSINLLLGENGIITKSRDAELKHRIGSVQEELEMKALEAEQKIQEEELEQEKQIEEFLNLLKEKGRITDADIEEDEGIHVTVDNLRFLVEIEEDVIVRIVYEGEAGKLLPKLKSIAVTKVTTNSVEIKAEAKRQTSYKYYIKESAEGTYELKEENNTGIYEYTNLVENKVYYIRVEAINANGIDYKNQNIRSGEFPTEVVDIANVEWSDSLQKARVRISTTQTGYQLQYTTTPENDSSWQNITSGETTPYNFSAGETVYARLYDGVNESSTYGQYLIGKETGNVTLSSASGTILYGNTGTFTATGTGNLSATSQNTEIATVSINNGTITITGIKAGTTTVTVSSAENYRYLASSATYTVTITGITNIGLTATKTTLVGGNVPEEVNVTKTITPSTLSSEALTWTSSNPNIATVDSNGKVKVKNTKGTATITATATDGTGTSASININVSKLIEYIVKDGRLQQTTILGPVHYVYEGKFQYTNPNGAAPFDEEVFIENPVLTNSEGVVLEQYKDDPPYFVWPYNCLKNSESDFNTYCAPRVSFSHTNNSFRVYSELIGSCNSVGIAFPEVSGSYDGVLKFDALATYAIEGTCTTSNWKWTAYLRPFSVDLLDYNSRTIQRPLKFFI